MRNLARLLAVLAVLALAACDREPVSSRSDGTHAAPTKIPITLKGVGSSATQPLYTEWFHRFAKDRPNLHIEYQSLALEQSLRLLSSGEADFGTLQGLPSDDQQKSIPRPVFWLPATLGAVAIVYNLPGAQQPLRLSPELIADVFLGRVRRFDDPRLVQQNPGQSLPPAELSLVVHSDEGGTTAVFTDYLAKVSERFRETVGQGSKVAWPIGEGVQGNQGVLKKVQNTAYSIGYVDLAAARQTELPSAELLNRAGRYVPATPTAVRAAALSEPLPGNLLVSLTNPSGADAYAISYYTYLVVFQDLANPYAARTLAELLWWIIHDGQALSAPQGHTVLPMKTVAAVEVRLKQLRLHGLPLLR